MEFYKVFHSGSCLVLHTNIRLGRKSMQVANTLAYYDTAIITAVKRFIVQAPGVKLLKLFLCNVSQYLREFNWNYDRIIINYELKRLITSGLGTTFIIFWTDLFTVFVSKNFLECHFYKKKLFSLQKCVRKFTKNVFMRLT